MKAFQKDGHTVGMCGDGANDAPALRQAQIGIAVSTATDVAKSAAGVVLTKAGLGGIVAAVKEGRITFQRILTYTLNSVIKKIVQVLLLAVGLVMTGHAVLTPLLMVIVMVTGDFLAMSLTTDKVRPSERPNSWKIGRITIAGVIFGLCFLVFCTVLLAFGKFELRLGVEALRTLAVVSVVYGSQATIYVIRDRRHFWGPPPSVWLVGSTVADLAYHHIFGNSWNRHGTPAPHGCRLRISSGYRFRVDPGWFENTCLRSARNLITNTKQCILTAQVSLCSRLLDR